MRNAIRTALLATNAFDEVWIWGLPEQYGTGASKQAAAAIDPQATAENDLYDDEGAIEYRCTITITLLYRNEDPQARDEGAELLLNCAQNALNGAALQSLDLPDLISAKTRFNGWAWQPAVAPERRIRAVFMATYLLDGWNSLDTTP